MQDISVRLTPRWDGETIPALGVELTGVWQPGADGHLFSINTRTTVKHFCRLESEIAVCDASGDLPCRTEETPYGPQIERKYWLPVRPAAGEVTIRYTVLLDEAGVNPVFDLGHEKGGMNGAGITFLPALPEGDYRYTLRWALGALPAGSRSVWSFGEGAVTQLGGGELLQDTFYAAGQLDSVRLGAFGYYWMHNDNILDTAVDTAKLFRYERAFFEDDGAPYTIIARHCDGEVARAGGTALERSYQYLYKNDAQLDPTWLKFLFAHEMVHNWVQMDNSPFGVCTWYVEGMAEYYSSVLPWRAGLVTREELCAELNKRAKQFYENPQRFCTNLEAGAGLFADPEKTRVPYGRGFFYLTHADHAIRVASGGTACLDDVMLALLRRWKAGERFQNEAWIAEYGKYVGEATARAEYEAMADGSALPVPETDCWPGIETHSAPGTVRGSGETCQVWVFT